MITLDYADKRPLYEQIKEKLRELIVSGALEPHERIPSVREMASGLSINPNTIQKAYHELEKEGYIYSKAAKGNYVSPMEDAKNAGSDRRNELYGQLFSAVSELKFLGTEKSEIIAKISELFD